MGTSLPPDPNWAPDTPPAEISLWRWAVDQLDDSVLVLPQIAMTVPQGGRYEEAEADLVLIDPEFGVVLVEIKGGTVSYDARQRVWRRSEGGARKIRDPVDQVKRVRSILRRFLEANGVDVEKLALRWAVAVPECRLDAPGGAVLDGDLLWDSLAGEQLSRMYARTCGTLTLGEEPPGDELAGYLSNLLRGRSVEGSASLQTLVDRHEAQVRVATESHRNAVHKFARHPRVLVHGAAGTGKTVLALQTAARFAALGERVLLACWNVVLARSLRQGLNNELDAMGSPVAVEVTDDPTGQVVVCHLVGLARHGYDGPTDIDDHELYYERMPDSLHPGVTQGEFDVVVLDEAQDLDELWVLAVSSLVAKDARWYAFTDPHQNLFGTDPALPDLLDVEHRLTENFRNSEQIAAFAGRFGPIEMDCVTGEGPPVRFVSCEVGEVVEQTDIVARRLMRDERFEDADVAVLWLFHNPFRHRSDEVADAAMNGELIRTNGASFKGMERPVVVLGLDMDPDKTDRIEEVRRSIYAATTRARSQLVVVGDPDVAEAYGFAELAADLRASES